MQVDSMIVLINMPFSSLFQPSLALSQFKAQLDAAGLPCRLVNLNFDFAGRIGFQRYEPLQRIHNMDMRLGEWCFAREAWGDDFGPSPEEFAALCRDAGGTLGNAQPPLEWLNRVREEVVPQFLDDAMANLFDAEAPTVVAFSSVFFQTIPSLALARRIKARSSTTRTVMGGAAVHGDMGRELLRAAHWLDAVSLGEADDVVVPLFRKMMAEEPPTELTGIAYRNSDGAIVESIPPSPVTADTMNQLPIPDFDDFMADVNAFETVEPGFQNAPVFLPYESSRGCWWAQQSACVFCGLNAEAKAHRAKDPDRVMALLEGLARRHGVRRLFATDNNFPRSFYKTLLPAMADHPDLKGVSFFYEIKTNVKREWMRQLARARVVHLQPGVESLSTQLLECLGKGVTGLENVYFLKLCRVFGLFPMWNFLIRVPGETMAAYDGMNVLMPKIIHFFPPTGHVRPVQVHRFSDYFNHAGRYLDDVAPPLWYGGLYPSDRVDLERVAYYFEGRWKDTIGQTEDDYPDTMAAVDRWVDTWRSAQHLPGLFFDPMETGPWHLIDTRGGNNGQWRLDALETAVFRHIDDPGTAADVKRAVSGNGHPSEAEVCDILDGFVANGLAIEESGTYLGLALPNCCPPLSLKHRREMFRRYV